MELKTSQWFDFATAVERGPLVYALKIREKKTSKDRNDKYKEFQEVHALDDWNYALIAEDLSDLKANIEIIEKPWDGSYPWNLESAPIELKMRGIQLPDWTLSNSAPVLPAWWGGRKMENIQFKEITLIPYGCTTLRITEFPVYNLH
jgi:hypothetical protein